MAGREGLRVWGRGSAVAAVVFVGIGIAWASFNPEAPKEQPAVAAATRGDIENTVLAAGTLQPFEHVDVGAQTSGLLHNLRVKVGDRVRRGELLAEIDPVIGTHQVTEAQGNLDQLRAQLRVKTEQAALSALQRDRAKHLLALDAVSRAESETATTAARVAEAEVAAVEAQIRKAQATLDMARANLGFARIVSPMDGEVVSISAREGQVLNSSQQAPTILRVARLDTMTVWAQVAEADVASLRIGQEAFFTVLGDTRSKRVGRLRQVLPSPEVINNVVFYHALFDVPNPGFVLKVQMTAQVSFVVDRAVDAVLVPISALKRSKAGGEGAALVRVARGDGTFEQREIVTGVRNAIVAEVRKGLAAGETVVTNEARAAKAEGKTNGPRRR